MQDWESEQLSIRITWEPLILDMRSLASQVGWLTDLVDACVALAKWRSPLTGQATLHPVALHWGSPLIVELAGDASAVWLLYWTVTHPERLGAFVPRVVASWRREWQKANQIAQKVTVVTREESTAHVLINAATSSESMEQDVAHQTVALARARAGMGVARADVSGAASAPPLPTGDVSLLPKLDGTAPETPQFETDPQTEP